MVRYKPTTEKGECIFCKIASGEIKPIGNGNFWNTEKYMAWLSPYPNTKGFTVLITKRHFPSDILAMPDKDLADFILETKKISKILINKLEDVGRVGLIMEGTGIDHAHIKLVPMHGTGHMKKGIWKQYFSNKSDYYEKYKGYIVSSDGPKADENEIKKLAEELKKYVR